MGRNNDDLKGFAARTQAAARKIAEKGIRPPDPARLTKAVNNAAKKRGR